MRIEKLLRSRWFPLAVQAPLLAVGVAILFLSLGPPRRSEMNVGAALVWQIWWALLPFFLLLTARAWCAVCPFATLASLLQWLPAPALPAWMRRRGAWMATAGLALVGFLFLLLSLENNGRLTAALLLVFALGAAATALLWRGRVWCRYLCPVGLMAGLYARLAWLRLEAADTPAAGTCARGCPLYTSPLSPRRAQDCVLCGVCLKAPGGEAVAVRVGAPSLPGPVLGPAEAAAVSLLLGLLLADALRMTPLYVGYMARAVRSMGGSYELAMALGIGGVVGSMVLAQVGVAAVIGREKGFWVGFARLSGALLPLALATQLGLSAQHLMALGDVARNLGAELGLLAPGHMPPTDAYVTLWPLKAAQWAMLSIGGATSLRVVGLGVAPGWPVSAALVGLLALALLILFALPMSVAC